jgi:hypothetical protein
MKTKLFTGLAAAAVLLIGGPAFGFDHSGGGGGGDAGRDVAAGHQSAPVERHASMAAVRNAPGSRSFVTRRNTGVSNDGYAASRYRATGNIARGGNSVAFGGRGNYAQNGRNDRNYAFPSHGGWDHGRQYYWQGRHYGWYGNGWYILDPYPYYGYGYYDSGYGDSGNVAVQVQAALSHAGYYQGPIDGIVGPGTSAAIAAFQRDNGLRVTGTITRSLVSDLGVG